MILQEAKITEADLLNSLWWLWCNQKISKSDINFYIKDLDLEIELITFTEYKFTSKDKKTTYSYGKQTTKESH
jgi:hypothetical protein